MKAKTARLAVEYIAASSALQDRLLAENQRYREAEKAASAKCDDVLQVLLQTGAAEPHQKNAALRMLSSHDATLDLLVNATRKMASYKTAAETAQASELGRAVTDKEAGFKSASTAYDSTSDPYVGRTSAQLRGSDVALRAVLSPPSR